MHAGDAATRRDTSPERAVSPVSDSGAAASQLPVAESSAAVDAGAAADAAGREDWMTTPMARPPGAAEATAAAAGGKSDKVLDAQEKAAIAAVSMFTSHRCDPTQRGRRCVGRRGHGIRTTNGTETH